MAFSSAFVARLDRLAIRGAFEAHLTVDRATGLAALCDRLGIGFVAIELAAGEHPAQPMTASHHHGALPAVIAEVTALHDQLVGAGFAVVRVKLEAATTNPGVPIGDGEAAGYFEFHVEVRDPDLSRLAQTCERHGARMSRNARGDTRFVTLRAHGVGRDTAEARLAGLLAALADDAHAIAGTIGEYTIYDSRLELDAGWL